MSTLYQDLADLLEHREARGAYVKADPEGHGAETIRHLDSALSFAHSALNGLLRQARVPPHNSTDFEEHYDVAAVPFREVI